MKIKQTRQVRLDELLQIVWSNPTKYESVVFESHRKVIPVEVQISNDGLGVRFLDGKGVGKSDLFTITEEVEITEDMVLPIVFVYWNDAYEETWTSNRRETPIKELLKIYDVKFIYLQNDDGSIGELIWKDGGLID